MRKRVLADRHHAGLFYSLQLLGDRLGWDVYTPVGYDWWDEGYWRFGEVYGDRRLADQYLAPDEWQRDLDGIYWTSDPEFPARTILGVSLNTAETMGRWDYVIATVQENQHGFHRFAMENGARYVYQVGNTGQQVDWSLDPIVLASSEVPIKGRGLRYHQEMHPAYQWHEPRQQTRIKSYINFAHVMQCWPLTVELWKALPDFKWSLHGGGMPDGVIKPTSAIAAGMADASWAMHDKVTGDGFGHVLWGWAAVGRPLIGHASHYAGKLGGVLWADLKTCIDLDQHDIPEAARLIREISADPGRHYQMCRAIRDRFEAYYDPAQDAANIARLLGA